MCSEYVNSSYYYFRHLYVAQHFQNSLGFSWSIIRDIQPVEIFEEDFRIDSKIDVMESHGVQYSCTFDHSYRCGKVHDLQHLTLRRATVSLYNPSELFLTVRIIDNVHDDHPDLGKDRHQPVQS